MVYVVRIVQKWCDAESKKKQTSIYDIVMVAYSNKKKTKRDLPGIDENSFLQGSENSAG